MPVDKSNHGYLSHVILSRNGGCGVVAKRHNINDKHETTSSASRSPITSTPSSVFAALRSLPAVQKGFEAEVGKEKIY